MLKWTPEMRLWLSVLRASSVAFDILMMHLRGCSVSTYGTLTCIIWENTGSRSTWDEPDEMCWHAFLISSTARHQAPPGAALKPLRWLINGAILILARPLDSRVAAIQMSLDTGMSTCIESNEERTQNILPLMSIECSFKDICSLIMFSKC